MLIIPAIDIIGGKCVRLTKGEFASKKVYSGDPIWVAENFEKQGARMLHIVDLDGSRTGEPKNLDLIAKIKAIINIPIQVGGGIRNLATAQKYFGNGIDRIIVGTKAIGNTGFLKELIEKFGGERIIVSIDSQNGKIASNGWQEETTEDALDFAMKLKAAGLTQAIVTDVTRDGTLTVPNFALTKAISNTGLKVIAAGGVSDAKSIKKLKDMGIFGAIIGKALYENKINLREALNAANPLSNLAKRIIPCLDVKNGRVVKGVNFQNLRDAGDPMELGKRYSDEGADELVFLDITASKENRRTIFDMVRRVAKEVFIPFTVGGGLKNTDEIRRVLQAGADKITLNTAAVFKPELIAQAAEKFGSQCIVVSIDVKKKDGIYKVFIKGGSEETELEAVSWTKKVESLGAGEIMLTSMDRDGTKKGFDLEILRKISAAVNIPVIASGGAGTLEDLEKAFTQGLADAALAASMFHYNEISIKSAKEYLMSRNIPMRI